MTTDKREDAGTNPDPKGSTPSTSTSGSSENGTYETPSEWEANLANDATSEVPGTGDQEGTVAVGSGLGIDE